MPFVIPYFIAHQGCPHQCLFCDQWTITGQPFSALAVSRDIEETIAKWLTFRKAPVQTQLAFYGGSFTCLPRERQAAMLAAVLPWLEKGDIEQIRLSTRPDCIDEDVCRFLKEYGVGVVELGVQSLDDEVLAASRRGHSRKDCFDAVRCLQKAGFETGIQLMPGLPQETRHSFRQTIRETVALQPDFVRIYPTVVVKNSGLAEKYRQKQYLPLSLELALVMACWARRKFLDSNIRVVRMGLQPSTSLEENVLAGPYHPAFGELVLARDWLRRTRKVLAENPHGKVKLFISERDLSCFNGLHRENWKRLENLGLASRLEVVTEKNLQRGSMHHVVC